MTNNIRINYSLLIMYVEWGLGNLFCEITVVFILSSWNFALFKFCLNNLCSGCGIFLFSVYNSMLRVGGVDACVQKFVGSWHWRYQNDHSWSYSGLFIVHFGCILCILYAAVFQQVNAGWVSNVFVDYCIYVCLFNEKYKNC